MKRLFIPRKNWQQSTNSQHPMGYTVNAFGGGFGRPTTGPKTIGQGGSFQSGTRGIRPSPPDPTAGVRGIRPSPPDPSRSQPGPQSSGPGSALPVAAQSHAPAYQPPPVFSLGPYVPWTLTHDYSDYVSDPLGGFSAGPAVAPFPYSGGGVGHNIYGGQDVSAIAVSARNDELTNYMALERWGNSHVHMEQVTFSRDGALVTDVSNPGAPRFTGFLVEMTILLGTAGSTVSVLTVYRNGVAQHTCTVPVNEAIEFFGPYKVRFERGVDILTVAFTTLGTGAADPTIFCWFEPLL